MSALSDNDIVAAHQRAEYTKGLRALADLLDNHPDVPLPYATGTGDDFDSDRVTFYLPSKAEMVAFVKAFPGTLTKEVEDSSHYGFKTYGALHGLHLYAAVDRNEVCTRVVTGTREVTEEIPDPEILATVPKVAVTKTVEDVRWDCHPLLAEATS